jgi:chromosome segregation ATPase
MTNMSNEPIANGSVNPNGSNEPKIEDKNIDSVSTLSDEELQLQKEQEKLQNIQKALEHTTQQYETLKSQLQTTRGMTKDLKSELKELEQDKEPESSSIKDSVQTIVQEQLESLKVEPRKKAFSTFFNKYPETVQDSELQTKLAHRYEQIKESNEMDTELILRDLESAYFSLRGAEIIKQQVANDYSSEQFSIGSRYTGATQMSAISTTNSNSIDKGLRKAAEDLRMPIEKVIELKKKGYL